MRSTQHCDHAVAVRVEKGRIAVLTRTHSCRVVCANAVVSHGGGTAWAKSLLRVAHATNSSQAILPILRNSRRLGRLGEPREAAQDGCRSLEALFGRLPTA